jgi:3-hydroxymyristoyl/3-hydroxydecanoyl-(acyl carrier protein) dehydratase
MKALDFNFTNVSNDSATWLVPAQLPYFEGHFPNNPILPAVAVIDVSLQLIQKLQKKPHLQIREIRTTKFMSPITPNTTVHLAAHLSPVETPNRWLVEWSAVSPTTDTKQSLAKIDLILS